MNNKEKKEILEKLQKDPVHHIERIQGVQTMLPYQKRIVESVAQHERTAVSACHDVGKTYTAGKIVLWFTSCFPGAKVVTTAPTFNQVKMLLWSEIRAGHARSKFPLGGEMLQTQWKLSEDWFAIGYTSRAEAGSGGESQGAASSFQGFHAPYILVIFDEATGIPKTIWTQMEGLMTSSFVRFLAIANPTTKACEFYNCFSDPVYNKLYLSCFDSPNFEANGFHTIEDLEAESIRLRELPKDEQSKELNKYQVVNTHLLTVRWVMRMVLKYGIDHPLVVSKCFGKFPDEDTSVLISLGTVEKAIQRDYQPVEFERVSIGVDVARFGSDKTVLTKIKGRKVLERIELVKRDTTHITGVIVKMVKDEPSPFVHIVVDGTGIGSGVVDALNEKRNERVLSQHVNVHEIHFGSAPYKPTDTDAVKEDLKSKYVNMKARIFVELNESLKTDLTLINDEEYLGELPTIKYRYDSKGRWLIESKDEYRARTGRGSPDSADSLALANFGRTDSVGVGVFTEELNKVSIKTISPSTTGGPQW